MYLFRRVYRFSRRGIVGKKLKLPWYPLEDDRGGHKYEITSYWEHLVSDYTKLSFIEIENLDYIDYLTFRRDAFISNLSQSEKGLEYLDNAYRIEQTKPDKRSLRAQFGEEG